MDKVYVLFLALTAATCLAGAPAASAPAAKAPAPAAAKTQTPPPVPAKPAVPEKKQPYELWLTAQTAALKAAAAGKAEEALAAFDEAEKVANQPTLKNQSLYEKVAFLAASKRYDEALALLGRPVARNRNTAFHKARVRLFAGEIMLRQERWDDAEKELRKALEADGSTTWISADARLDLGRLCERRKDTAGALKYYNELTGDAGLLPGNRVRGVMAVAEMYLGADECDKALAALDEAAKIEQIPADKETELALLRCAVLRKQNKKAEALKVLREAERIAGRSPFCQAHLICASAALLLEMNRIPEARNMILRARAVRGAGASAGFDQELFARINREFAKFNRQRQERERRARAWQQRQKQKQQQQKQQQQKKQQNKGK